MLQKSLHFVGFFIFIIEAINSLNAAISAYTPYLFGSSHPALPLSPWHESTPPSVKPAQNAPLPISP